MKAQHPDIPWKDIAGIGNVPRHDYENVIPDAMWKVVNEHLAPLEKVCRTELKIAQIKENGEKFKQAEQERQAGAGPGRDDRSI